ncbi:MAG: alpha/beta hydrolase [Novosphingobium sp.]
MGIDFAFIHGGGQGAWVWDETIRALTAQSDGQPVRTLALDSPGCGAKRDRSIVALTLDDVADELIRDIEAVGLNRPVLVGHSQGGQVMSLMLERRPDLFARAVYVSCSIPLPGQSVQEMLGTGVHGSEPDKVGWPFDPSQGRPADHYATMFCNDMTAEQQAAFLAKLGNDAWPLSTYAFTDWRFDHHGTVPATFIVCLRDNILPAHWQERFAERFVAERIVRIDAGHQAMNTRPHTLAEILRHEID